MEVVRVKTNKELKQFIDFRYDLYRNSKYDVPHLFADERDTLRKDKNPAFEFCEAEYFLAIQNGKIVGRIAGIINHRANEKWNTKIVRFGWLEFIDDEQVSSALINAVTEWGKSKNMTEIVGPMGFTDMDKEGMMVEGFEELGNFFSTYNYSYYPTHLDLLGFEKDNDYLLYKITIPETPPEKFKKIVEIADKRYNLHAQTYSRKELVKKDYAKRIFEILNETYKNLYGFAELSERQIDAFINSFVKIADAKLIVGITDGNRNDEIVGFGVSFPSLAKALQKMHNGRLFPFGWWQLAKVLLLHKTDTVDLVLIGVLPEYRLKGANALIFSHLIQEFKRQGYVYAEAMQQMETNANVQANWQYMTSRQHKRLRCYKKLI